MNEDWQEPDIAEARIDTKGDFKSTLFLSTDGKLTISVEASTPDGRKAGNEYAVKTYNWLKSTFGSKQAYSAKEYAKADESSLGNCSKCGAPNKMSKNNKIYCSAKCWL